MRKKRIGVLTSGGDCPGLNAVLRGLVCAATKLNWEVIGFHEGYEGLLPPARHQILDLKSTAGIMPLGGTLLGTTNKGHFVAKVGHGQKARLSPHIIKQTKATMADLHIDCLICIGGDGSLNTAHQLYQAGINTIGVPKTIDNDIGATAMTFGFDSAVACVAEALDRLHTTARSHKRVMVLEVMGRYVGWIALHGGLAGGADIILLPEIPFDFEKINQVIHQRESAGFNSTMIVVAEGAKAQNGKYFTKNTGSSRGETALGGVGDHVARAIALGTGKETRCVVLGHLQRGGSPTAWDRILGTRFGVQAIELAQKASYGSMVSYQNDLVGSVSMAQAISKLKQVAPNCQLVNTCRKIGIHFGDRLPQKTKTQP
jgi:ATP-dependent phosphofructokinase / diphosphate-dependent phosphofructokinase